MKSETYQKEGWSTLEEENQVLGKVPEALENTENLESEDFIFYNQNKEEVRNNLDSSAKDLTDFIDSFIEDIPAPSEEEIKKGKEKILERIQVEPIKTEKKETSKNKKVTLKVLFLAAVLSVLSVSGLFALGNSRNISIENGFMAFAKETVQVVFFGEDEKEYISIDSLLLDLEKHGYDDILFPEEFIIKSDEYKASVPEYLIDELMQVSFEIDGDETNYKFAIHEYDPSQQSFDYVKMHEVQTITVSNNPIYVFVFNNETTIEFIYNGLYFFFSSDAPYSDMIKIAESLK